MVWDEGVAEVPEVDLEVADLEAGIAPGEVGLVAVEEAGAEGADLEEAGIEAAVEDPEGTGIEVVEGVALVVELAVVADMPRHCFEQGRADNSRGSPAGVVASAGDAAFSNEVAGNAASEATAFEVEAAEEVEAVFAVHSTEVVEDVASAADEVAVEAVAAEAAVEAAEAGPAHESLGLHKIPLGK